jgi:hypothetical protein
MMDAGLWDDDAATTNASRRTVQRALEDEG